MMLHHLGGNLLDINNIRDKSSRNWPRFKNEKSFIDSENFIGGDKIKKFIDLSDLAVYGDEIYILDGAATASSETAVKINVYAKKEASDKAPTEQTAEVYKNSGIYVLNSDYTIKERMNIFQITKEAAVQLAQAYYYE